MRTHMLILTIIDESAIGRRRLAIYLLEARWSDVIQEVFFLTS